MFKSVQFLANSFPFFLKYLVTYFLGLFVLPFRQFFLMSPFCKHFFLCFPFSFLHLLFPCFWPFNLLPPPLFLPLLDIAPPPLALCPSEQTTRQANKRMAIRILTLRFFQVVGHVIALQVFCGNEKSHRSQIHHNFCELGKLSSIKTVKKRPPPKRLKSGHLSSDYR